MDRHHPTAFNGMGVLHAELKEYKVAVANFK